MSMLAGCWTLLRWHRGACCKDSEWTYSQPEVADAANLRDESERSDASQAAMVLNPE